MSKTITDKVIAFAGILQATHCVKDIARTGRTDNDALRASIESLFVIDAEKTEDVYGGLHGLRYGIGQGAKLFASDNKQIDMESMQYTIAAIQLERKLARQPQMLAQIADGIERARQQAAVFTTTHENVIANLAGLYSDTISTLKPRILVNGDPTWLNDTQNVQKIRALLLAALRSAVLWRQSGGTRLQLLFSRKKYLAEFQRLFNSLNIH
ncbi:MAG: high frequency lysogenization protein HflD [Granulosicoccaceae bacterium]|jgi:high frequency lysogenization protein